jgi:hypothetical protein
VASIGLLSFTNQPEICTVRWFVGVTIKKREPGRGDEVVRSGFEIDDPA